MRRLLLMAAFLTATSIGLAKDKSTPMFVEEGERFRFEILEDDQGGFYTVWTHQSSSATFTLMGQHSDAQGTPQWPSPGRLLATLDNPDDWGAFADGKVGLTLTWVQNGRTRAQRYSTKGTPSWQESRAISASSATCTSPTGVADASGGAYFVWGEQLYPNRSVLIAHHVKASGALLWPAGGMRVSLRPSDQRRSRVTFDGQSGLVAVWKDAREYSSQLMAQRIDFSGNKLWGLEGILVTAPAGSARDFPLLAPMGDGGAVFGWIGGTTANRIYLQAVDGRGQVRWNPQGMTLTVGTWGQWNPTLIGDGRGHLWMSWEDYRNETRWQAFAGHVDSAFKSPWPGAEVPVAPVAADQGRISIVEDGRGGIFCAWVDNRQGRPGVYVQEIDNLGRLLLGKEGQKVAFGLKDPSRPHLALLAPGRAGVFYADRERKDRWALYWKTVGSGQP